MRAGSGNPGPLTLGLGFCPCDLEEGLCDRIIWGHRCLCHGRGGVSAVCGKPKAMGRIYGGREVLEGRWPWQASLLFQRGHVCGAVLIDPLWLVSTAHCFLNKSHAPADYRVLLGSTQLYQYSQHAREMSLSRIIVHPDFERHHPFGSDIVMLQLRLPVNLTSYIAPACLPSPGMQLSSSLSCWITGWGMLSEDSEGVQERRAEHLHSPFHLQEGKVSLIENEFCNVLYRQRLSNSKTYSVQEEMLCAGDFSTGKAICQELFALLYILDTRPMLGMWTMRVSFCSVQGPILQVGQQAQGGDVASPT
ncbi:putative serine protease 47 [Mirounga angustirostris]|uniref:putative serine protease 47 n=1 Tax=Mirounga angustirostris TaxID=9716 RepID=UPI0023E3AA29|nr:putative serine protease 47 [Mirounga angustirostris]